MSKNIEEFEKKVNKYSLLMYVCGIVIAIITFFIALFVNELLAILIFCGGIGCVFWIGSDKNKELKSKYKGVVVQTVLDNKFEKYDYNYKDGFDEDTIKKLNLFHKWKIFSSYDYLSSDYNGVKFEMSNVYIKGVDRRFSFQNENERYNVCYFFGQWYVFEFEHNFKSEFIAATKGMILNLKCFGEGNFKSHDKLFNKVFKLTSLNDNVDDIDVEFCIIDILMEIYNTIGCDMIFRFEKNKLYIGINSSMTFFEQRKHVPINVKREREDVCKEIDTLTYLIDIFNSDKTMFK